MNSYRWKKTLVIQGLIGVLSTASVVYAEAPAAKWYDTITLGGYVQGSYVGNLEAGPLNKSNVGRQFDTDGNSFNLNTALLSVSKPVGDDHYGFMAKFRTGKDAKTLAGSTATNEFFVQEAYVTYALPSLSKLSFTGGKFVTPLGYEGVDTVYNPNFSEGLLFTYAEPITHTGVKANYVFTDKVNATLGLVNGWDVTTDNNDGKTILWQVATTPTKQISWSFQGLYGDEIATPGAAGTETDHSKRLSLDTVIGFNPLDKLSLALQADWGQESKNPNTNHWSGLGIWASYASTSKCTETIRFEVLSDQNNAGRFTTTNFADGTTNQTVKEVTLTHKTMLASNLGTRLEYRYDWSNQAYFLRKDGSAVRTQKTISADLFVTF